MRKILLVLVAILLIAGSAQAVEWTQSVTAEYAAQNVGRARATDSSVMFKVWCKDGILPFSGVGVSSSTSIIIYRNYANGTQVGYTLDTSNANFDTVGEIVDYINTNFASDSSVQLNASVGNDAYRAMATFPLVPANIIANGTTQDNTTAQVLKQSNDRISAGAEAKTGVINRIKSFHANIPAAVGSGGVTLRIYDGNTQIWRKYVNTAPWNTATDPSNSANSVIFPDVKGLSSTSGNGLVVEAVADTNQVNGSTAERSGQGVSIVYDQLRQ